MIRTWSAVAALLLALSTLVGCSASETDGPALMGSAASAGDAPPPNGFDQGASPESDSPDDDSADDDPALPEPEPTVTPATGIKMTRPSYSYRAPTEWTDITKQMKESGGDIDSAVGEDLSAVTAVRENLNVVLTPALLLDIEDYESIAPATLELMVKDLKTFPRVLLGGVEAIHVGGVARTGDSKFYFEQVAAKYDDTMYAVSFAVDLDRSEAERRALVDSVLASWKWPDQDQAG